LGEKLINLDDNIGTIDLETYGTNLGLGCQKVFACGWSIKNKTELFYIKPRETSEHLVNRLFLDILNNSELNGYTFYIHNLGRFDSIFILKSLIKNNKISMTPVWKDNGVLSVTIKYKDMKIKLLDSLQLIKGNLNSILKSFNCNIMKGHFPYSFVNKSNLNYIGNKPDISKYNKITQDEYDLIPFDNWDLKKETLKYLKKETLKYFQSV